MLTSYTELAGENVASALTLVGNTRFICKQNPSCCRLSSRACAALAASLGGGKMPRAGEAGSQCGKAGRVGIPVS